MTFSVLWKSHTFAVILAVLLMCCATVAFGGWTVLPEEMRISRDTVGASYDPEKGEFATFEEVIEELKKDGSIQRLARVALAHSHDYDPVFQKELCAELKRLAPREFAEAERSSGNLHNPKVIALYRFFEQAVQATPTVQNIKAKLAPFGLQVTKVDRGEKLHFVRVNDQLHFKCILSLGIGKTNEPSSVQQAVPQSESPIVSAARSQIGKTVMYDSGYVRLAYPMGDIPLARGVCTDVVVRALRDALKMDLQQLVHEDMTAAFSAYPNNWGLKQPDRNIDHRRVPNLKKYFERKGFSLAVSKKPEDYLPGDLVTCTVGGNRPHIMVVSDKKTAQGIPLIIHNIGSGTQEEDRLFSFPLTGHYRITKKIQG